MLYIFLGKPGAGKGTLAEYAEVQYSNKKKDLIYISTGDLFRAICKLETKLAQEVKQTLGEGLLINDNLTNRVFLEKFSQYDNKLTFILDGYPRTINQAKFLQEIIQKHNFGTYKVIYLDCAQEILINRLCGRRICPKCYKVYNVVSKKPRIENHCDFDNELLIQRKDDSKSSVETRIKVYEKVTEPLINFYSELGILQKVNVESISVSEIFKKVFN